jgi:hypothetical protein
MNKITLSEIKNIYEYEKIRTEYRVKIIAEKKNRRMTIGDNITIIFENRNSVLFQIQEMIRTEKIITDAGMQHEIDTYNQILPADNELSATLLIDITDKEKIRPTLDSLIGLNKSSLFVKIGEKEIVASFDDSQGDDNRISAVQYVKWHLSDHNITSLGNPEIPVSIVVRHSNYNAAKILSINERNALHQDLTNP